MSVSSEIDMDAAMARLKGVVKQTPVLRSRLLDDHVGTEVHLKAENLQTTGAFKFRGAFNAIAALNTDVRDRGIISFSSGNHAQAVARAAQLFNVPATIVMPHDAPASKRSARKPMALRLFPTTGTPKVVKMLQLESVTREHSPLSPLLTI